ncbi:MAG: hypothetical protein ACJAT2_000246 [Bacteriovoracaceae bacterium]|jgi:hypothetical protein
MPKYIIIISLLFLSSCIRKKKLVKSDFQPRAVLYTTAGLFNVGPNIFLSDGKKSYCSFEKQEDAKNYAKKQKVHYAVVPSETRPMEMTYTGKCEDSLLKD